MYSLATAKGCYALRAVYIVCAKITAFSVSNNTQRPGCACAGVHAGLQQAPPHLAARTAISCVCHTPNTQTHLICLQRRPSIRLPDLISTPHPVGTSSRAVAERPNPSRRLRPNRTAYVTFLAVRRCCTACWRQAGLLNCCLTWQA
jgi:hypothetical protein